jgi:hypothetical protein
MRVPQVSERVKEAPAQALRAMFAGIGQLLSASDKIRGKSATAEAPAEAKAAAPETVTPETVTPETVTPETVTPETVTPETSGGGHVKVVPGDAAPAAPAASTGELPLTNYDDLTIASLRARLRNLSADQLAQLVDYEKSHANRADVIQMFERRIAKLAEG